MSNDPIEREYDENRVEEDGDDDGVYVEATNFIDVIESSNAWNNTRESIAQAIWNMDNAPICYCKGGRIVTPRSRGTAHAPERDWGKRKEAGKKI